MPGVPISVNLVPSSSTQLKLSWGTPSVRNGVILSYYITWRIVRNDTNHVVDGKLKTRKVELPNPKSFIIQNLGE